MVGGEAVGSRRHLGLRVVTCVASTCIIVSTSIYWVVARTWSSERGMRIVPSASCPDSSE
eukprot:10268158-Ditylum_brightwellii.AAC.1